MKGDEHSITVTEKILDSEDLSDKKGILKNYTNSINDYDKAFFNLVDSIIVNEDQKGKIVEAMLEKTKKFKGHNQNLTEDVDQQINKTVNNLNEQVEDMKIQLLTIKYRDNI
ncbi:hypothetical protein F3157_21745 [Virgibacillus dakarensis]|uniref:Uncharacterized protein n=1 Tax=Lentibacillus populi TaxID=1827502 RepID=A0A9W5X437_9BACI|nr:hypothetical protein [Lentibacillus populi]MBT2218027.1 hypothetical protein [Virgibacillus dakarensis]MTW88220.1 hypothetical protein [Virgibacillus dakarensis]GGB32115.1 hypothetical protein GCM10011409_06880 [Lentibacillus populi]